MNLKLKTVYLLSAILLLFVFPAYIYAAGQTSETFRVVADVFVQSSTELALGSESYQASVSVGQFSLSSMPLEGSTIKLASGYQATTEGFDSDYDGIPDNDDSDTDGDGYDDTTDARPYDTDNDGLNNIGADVDDDNDGLADIDEWSFGTSWIYPDTDNDTQNDYDEWIAGTSGTNSNDYFKISEITGSGGGLVTLTWRGVAGRHYSVVSTNTLLGVGEWSQLWSTNVDDSVNVIYEYAPSDNQQFFKVNVSKP